MKYTPVAVADKLPAKPGPRAKSGKVVARKSVPPGEIRIIGGLYKRSKLPVPNKPGLRPTPDRVRETLFNWLGQDLRGWRCMDVFAGTGALGFEAASRGAAEVLLCEQDAGLVAKLDALRLKLQADMVRVERGDGLSLLRRQSAGSLQLVFLDPPFDSPLFEPALKAAAQVVADAGYVYLEAPQAWDDEALAAYGLQVHRSGKAGAVFFHLLVRSNVPA
ncbi:16S rRNA (guanine(966)-N(2))-methyltransferase RsmD [Polaromonas sp. SM01]|uniref:16S rRNA (guanine(966)-N(2))-methyltransferase RsmD n=1 Tax=Polaromonas sp. SM01 TaxID=3085630 RepID=UPI002980E769|nr:16S rRNA (guanine(966)-N(2))-methyltransferase RsmD [Polaromonas sp. SM01]MDW5442089.1 16S rRNA (guanine(966)-N(2))-methyltransferase RsmD [Polaromonas sp. SM01]